MRRALVTGGQRGIGAAIAARLAADGFEALVTSRAPGPGAYRLELREGVEALAAEVGAVDVLVHNAAVVKDGMLRFFSDADWAEQLEVDLTGAFKLARAFVPAMQERRWGRVVLIGSYVGRAGAAGRAGYAAAKAGLAGLTRSLAREVAADGVTVNLVDPGLILTERTAGYRPEVLARAVAEIPLGRAGTPAEVAGLVAFLASEAAGYVTGQALAIDGGLSA